MACKYCERRDIEEGLAYEESSELKESMDHFHPQVSLLQTLKDDGSKEPVQTNKGKCWQKSEL
jgi:hypothetical protein